MSDEFVAALETEMAALREALGRDVRYVRLREIEKLRELYRDPTDATDGAPSVPAQVGTNEARPQHRPPVRRASPERAQAMDAARLYVLNRAGPAPTTDVYDHLVSLGLTIKGENPVNNLSAMMSNSGLFKANGRAGWTIRQSDDGDEGDVEEDRETSPDDDRDAQFDRETDEMTARVEVERTPSKPWVPPPTTRNDQTLPPASPRPRPAREGGADAGDFIAQIFRGGGPPRNT